jgi:hypothetical protein
MRQRKKSDNFSSKQSPALNRKIYYVSFFEDFCIDLPETSIQKVEGVGYHSLDIEQPSSPTSKIPGHVLLLFETQ